MNGLKLILDTNYSDNELDFIEHHHCEIISEWKYPEGSFQEHETPRRMLRYGDILIAEIWDSDESALAWAVMSTGRFRGKYVFTYSCDNLEHLVLGL